MHRGKKTSLLPSAFVLAAALLAAALLAAALAPNLGAEQPAASGNQLPPPVHLTADQDHQRVMDMLHITWLRPGAEGDPKSARAANSDESKAGPFSKLPDPLQLNHGGKVKTANQWWTKRRPELIEIFDREIYGRVPANTPQVNWEVANTAQEKNGAVPVITKKIVGHVDNSAYPLIHVDIQLTLSTPKNANRPVPVIIELGLSPEVLAQLQKRYPQFFSGQNGPTWQQQVLAEGWGYAEYIPTSVQADNAEGLAEGIIGLVNHGQPRKPDDWGALRAWAWGASRVLDYFESDKTVDPKRVAIEGHSRYGKASLVAMANDPRFAAGFISSSGEAGAKLFRRNFGEQIGNIAGGEYYWMAGNFIQYDGPKSENDLPVDAHEMIALCAPRPVFISAGSVEKGDGWVDPKGMFLAAVAAGPVYRLLGGKDLGTSDFPPIETPLVEGDIGFRQHSDGHTPGPNWPTFIQFASRHFTAAGVSRKH